MSADVMESKIETYHHNLYCSNCGKEISIEIPKGYRWEDYIKGVTCPNCGCNPRG